MSGLKLAIFDMDGTLIDSQHVIVAAMHRTYAAFGAPAPDDEAIRRIIGLSLPQVFEVLSPDVDPADNARLVALYKDSFLTMRAEGVEDTHAPLFPGARDALDDLASAGFLLSVATGKARRGLDHAVDAHGLHGIFSFTQTADDARSKPHPEMVERCMRLHGVDAAQTVMVGDTGFDMSMARAAGARAIGVGWGYHPRAMLTDGGAEHVIDQFNELKGAAQSLLGP